MSELSFTIEEVRDEVMNEVLQETKLIKELIKSKEDVNIKHQEFLTRLDERNSWGKNQVKELFIEVVTNLKI